MHFLSSWVTFFCGEGVKFRCENCRCARGRALAGASTQEDRGDAAETHQDLQVVPDVRRHRHSTAVRLHHPPRDQVPGRRRTHRRTADRQRVRRRHRSRRDGQLNGYQRHVTAVHTV